MQSYIPSITHHHATHVCTALLRKKTSPSQPEVFACQIVYDSPVQSTLLATLERVVFADYSRFYFLHCCLFIEFFLATLTDSSILNEKTIYNWIILDETIF